MGQNNWSEWQNHVLAELKRLSNNIEGLEQSVQDHREQTVKEIAALKVKAGVWGGIAGCIPVVTALILYVVYKLNGG